MSLRTAMVIMKTPLSPRVFRECVRAMSTIKSYDIPPNIRENTSFAVCYNVHGDPQHVLTDKCEPVKRPLEHGEVLVKMLMAPVNPSDLDVVNGTFFAETNLPNIAGNEGVGQVVEVGCGVTNLVPGNWVIPADFDFGTWRTMVVKNACQLMKVPNNLPILGAATLSVAPCTAYRMLKGIVDLKPGDVIIQDAANSSVGQAVVQLAREFGLVSINVVRDRPNVDILVQHLGNIGATHVITDKFLKSGHMKYFIKALKKKPKLAIDCVGGKIANHMLRYLDPDGIIATYGEMSCQPIDVPSTGRVKVKQTHVHGFWQSMWSQEHGNKLPMEQIVRDLCIMMKEGKFLPPPCDIYTLRNYRFACWKAREPFKPRKIVLQIAEENHVHLT